MLLAIETAHAACSVAMIEGTEVVARRHEVVGRGHAERIAPMIAEVLAGAGATPTAIVVDVGPGSFTGIRVGVAAARALGLAWRVPVGGFSSTALVAAAAFDADPAIDTVTVAMDGGRGELFVEEFKRPLQSLGEPQALTPEAAAGAALAAALAGTGAAALAKARGDGHVTREEQPDAADVRLLDAASRSLPPSPIYVRAPDAKLPVA